MVYRVRVEPLGDGWAVRSPAVENALVFLKGACAEAAAKALAERLSLAGLDVLIEFQLRDGGIIRRFACPRRPAIAAPKDVPSRAVERAFETPEDRAA